MKAIVYLLLLVSTLAHAQEQLVVRLNEQGMMKVLQMALKYNTGKAGSKTVIVPQNFYTFTIKQKQLASNPIIKVVSEISNLNLNKDVNFYLQTAPIKVNGVVDMKSLTSTISNSGPNGFDLKLSLNIQSLTATSSAMSLCEDKIKNQKKCGKGLRITVKNLKIVTKKYPVTLSAVLRLSIKDNVASVKVISVNSNLESKKSPQLDINFDSIEMPKISILINDQETELDTSKLKDEILERKDYLGKKLLNFAGDFITSDLAEMINVYLANARLPTRWESETALNSNEHFNELDSVATHYVRPPTFMPDSMGFVPSPSSAMEAQIASILRNAKITLSLKSMTTPFNKDIQLAGLIKLILNQHTINVPNRLGNRNVTAMPALDLNVFRNSDINLAISEPVINGALDLIGRTGLFQDIYASVGKTPGFSLNHLQIHFASDKTLRAIILAEIDLSKTESSGFGGWIKKQWAIFRERNNNDSKIYFPLEITIIPKVITVPGGVGLSLYVKSPFNGANLMNTFNYPSNIAKMKSEVRSGVMDEIKKGLGEHVNKQYTVDVTKFMNQSGVVFEPKGIYFESGAYLVLKADIKDIKFSSSGPGKK